MEDVVQRTLKALKSDKYGMSSRRTTLGLRNAKLPGACRFFAADLTDELDDVDLPVRRPRVSASCRRAWIQRRSLIGCCSPRVGCLPVLPVLRLKDLPPGAHFVWCAVCSSSFSESRDSTIRSPHTPLDRFAMID